MKENWAGTLKQFEEFIYSYSEAHTLTTIEVNLIFMDPCIVVWFSRNNQQDAAL